nr:PREDICTED: mediator of RNA polymerase II transcription subunit 23-like [Nicotiana tabacum]
MLRAPTPTSHSNQATPEMEQPPPPPPPPQLRSSSSSVFRSHHHHFHPSRPAILDLFNLYLGLKNSGQKSDDSIREPP